MYDIMAGTVGFREQNVTAINRLMCLLRMLLWRSFEHISSVDATRDWKVGFKTTLLCRITYEISTTSMRKSKLGNHVEKWSPGTRCYITLFHGRTRTAYVYNCCAAYVLAWNVSVNSTHPLNREIQKTGTNMPHVIQYKSAKILYVERFWTKTRKRGNCECIATWGSPTPCSPYQL